MANIIQYLQDILSARYGKDVRQSIHDAIEEINNVNEANIGTVQAIANTAQGYANSANTSASTAVTSATNAATSESNASDSAEDSEAWAVGKRGGVDVPSTDDTYQNNAKYWQGRANYWYQQAQAIAESFSGALRPMGTVAFANLPPIAEAEAGDMYNVSDEFTTTSDFKEGTGHQIPLGSNVYKTNDGKWDVLAGSPVTGIKGDSESAYRKGNVNITKANIGLGNVDNESLGSADISSIGDGSVKGAISRLNSDLTRFSQMTAITYKGVELYISKLGNIVTISLNGTANAKISANEHILNLEGAYSNDSVGQDIRIPSGQRFILHYGHYICFGDEIANGASIRGSVMYACPNFTPLT